MPRPDETGDKEERGRVLVVGGSRETPGALLLAAVAALRAGAGKLRIAAGESIAGGLGIAVPEARVFGLDESPNGLPSPASGKALAELGGGVDALLVGPGMTDPVSSSELVGGLLPLLRGPVVVLDAGALSSGALMTGLPGCRSRTILTPHAGEMAALLGMDKGAVEAEPDRVARHAAREFHAVVALKGAETVVAGPNGETYRNKAGNVGLATSGSGDTLAGVIAGLAARGADPLQAAAWGVALHARAGDRLARKLGPLGFLARELLDEIPLLLRELGPP